MAGLFESVKSFFSEPDVHKNYSSTVTPDNLKNDLTDDDNYAIGAFFDLTSDGQELYYAERESLLSKQAKKIQSYRSIAMEPDVSAAIDIIVNEVIFSYDSSEPIQLMLNLESEKVSEALNKSFQKINRLMNTKRNIYNIVKTGYVDGQLIFQMAYDEKSTKKGIKHINMIDPIMFYWDANDKKYKYSKTKEYMKNHQIRTSLIDVNSDKHMYSREEIAREDFGIHQDFLNIGYLEYALKPANVLQTLEDLLVPLRFSRSISRRVFNVDIGDLSTKRGSEVMREYQRKFQYKKFFNSDTGEIANQQHITSMVEDYWFANRSGGRGTSVDTLDETGNLGELDDIIYYSKKLYRSLRVPDSYSPYSDESVEFDYDTTRTSQEELQFFMFISRLRLMYTSLFKDVLKREVISTGVLTEDEWDDLCDEIVIRFSNENAFIEKMKTNMLLSQVDVFSTLSEHKGKLFSVETILKTVFRYSDEQIDEELERIEKEKKDKKYANFYAVDDNGY